MIHLQELELECPGLMKTTKTAKIGYFLLPLNPNVFGVDMS